MCEVCKVIEDMDGENEALRRELEASRDAAHAAEEKAAKLAEELRRRDLEEIKRSVT